MTSPPGDHRVNFYDEFQASGTAQAEGSMNIPGINKNKTTGAPEYNTLDEPIKTTIMRDLTAVGVKFRHVLQPQEKSSLLKEWDLWGPLLLCTFMAIVLQGDSDDRLDHDGGPQFAEVFVIVWIGSAVVTLNSKLLGGNISFFQSVCVLGYCLSLEMSLINLVTSVCFQFILPKCVCAGLLSPTLSNVSSPVSSYFVCTTDPLLVLSPIRYHNGGLWMGHVRFRLVPRRQSTIRQERFGRVPDIPVLFGHCMADSISLRGLVRSSLHLPLPIFFLKCSSVGTDVPW
uniref:Protein YIPF n=1 Tax=Cacopsylla melanoneura TaxID=428564 RepID=A0A8D8ZUR7_9HEMI